jgi:hypothetical protein
VRDPRHRADVALLDPEALTPAQKFTEETWILHFGSTEDMT